MDGIIHIDTPSGFSVDIPRAALDDATLVDYLMQVDDGNELYIVKAAYRLMGQENKDRLFEFCKDEETGITPFTKIVKVIYEILEAPELKK